MVLGRAYTAASIDGAEDNVVMFPRVPVTIGTEFFAANDYAELIIYQ